MVKMLRCYMSFTKHIFFIGAVLRMEPKGALPLSYIRSPFYFLR